MRSAVGQLLDFSTPRARVVLVPARPRADLLAYLHARQASASSTRTVTSGAALAQG